MGRTACIFRPDSATKCGALNPYPDILRVDVTEAVKVALVAGATRGAGRAIAVELARAGFYVHATGRSSRATGPSEIGRPETIEETGG